MSAPSFLNNWGSQTPPAPRELPGFAFTDRLAHICGESPRPGEAPPGSSDTQSAANAAPIPMPLWKRGFDLAFVFLTAPLWLPLMALFSLTIKLVSRGPVFYRQQRIGIGGVPFMLFKFRSMKVNTETQCHEEHLDRLIKSDRPMTKLDATGDPRLIPGGRWFRASAMDELPQLLNVLRGEMSLVGPRPCTPHEFERYQPRQKQDRTIVLPGLTGYWQVNGKNRTTFTEMVAMDLYYGQRMSLRLDLAIIVKTIPVLVQQVLEIRARKRQAKENQSREQASAITATKHAI